MSLLFPVLQQVLSLIFFIGCETNLKAFFQVSDMKFVDFLLMTNGRNISKTHAFIRDFSNLVFN